MRTFTIELRVDFDSDMKAEKEEVIKQAALQAARQLLTQAMLVSGKRQPQCVVHSGDFFNGPEELRLSIEGGDETG
jgi:uncharacterized protein YhaN